VSLSWNLSQDRVSQARDLGQNQAETRRPNEAVAFGLHFKVFGRNKVIFRRLKPAAAFFFPKLASPLKISGSPRG